jgi:hypothetical protein
MLLQHLAKTAQSVGIARFTAEVPAENRAMLTVFHVAGFPIESKTELGVVELTMTIAPELWETATSQRDTLQSGPGPVFARRNIAGGDA